MSTTRNGVTVAWLGMGVFVWSMLRVWQGLDFIDMGYMLTGYQQFYTYPQGIGDGLVNWLTYFFGHWVGVVLGGGVLSYKLGYVLVVTATALLAYLVLGDVLGRSRALAALVLLTALYVGRALGNWVGYNNLTALFYLAGAALLYWGLVDKRQFLLAMAGVVLGANIFVRFPNVLGVALLSAVWLHAYACRWSARVTLVWSAWFLGGFVFGAVIIGGLIVWHGHAALYVQGFKAIFNMAADVGSHHSGEGLLKLFFKDQMLAFVLALPIIVIGLMIASWISKQNRFLATVTAGFSAYLLTCILYYADSGYSDSGKWIITGLCYVVLLFIVFREIRNNQPLALMAFIAVMLLVLVPLGSNNGIANAKFGLWLALPLTLIWLWRGTERMPYKFSVEVGAWRTFAGIIMLALLYQSFSSAWRYTYNDSQQRLTMTYSIAHPLLSGSYTTAERAEIVSQLLYALRYFVKPGDELLAYNEIPTIHFLTETHPWLGNPWPELMQAGKIAFLLSEKERSGTKLPIIVRAKGRTSGVNWPVIAVRLNFSESRWVFAEFERRHGYVVVWSNMFFEILESPLIY